MVVPEIPYYRQMRVKARERANTCGIAPPRGGWRGPKRKGRANGLTGRAPIRVQFEPGLSSRRGQARRLAGRPRQPTSAGYNHPPQGPRYSVRTPPDNET